MLDGDGVSFVSLPPGAHADPRAAKIDALIDVVWSGLAPRRA
jgi:hypothetical protein